MRRGEAAFVLLLFSSSLPASAATKHRIAGVVRGEADQPIPDAAVTLRANGSFVGETVRTNAEGRFEIEFSARGPYVVGVFVEGYVPWGKGDVPDGAELLVSLSRGRAVEGVVVDKDTGHPIAGARVEATGANLQLAVPVPRGTGRPRAETDARGVFRAEGLPDADVRVTASARGYGRTELVAPADSTQLVLALSPGVGIQGRVVGPDGAPVEGARVQALVRRDAWNWWPSSLDDETGAAGTFALYGVEPEPYRILVERAGFAFAIVTEVVPGSDDVDIGDVELEAGTDLVGRLVDVEGRAVSGKVTLQSFDGEAVPMGVDAARVATTEDGLFRFEKLPEGELGLVLEAPGFVSENETVTLRGESSREPFDAGEFVLGDGLRIAGQVLDEEGVPIEGAQLSATSASLALDLARGVARSASAQTEAEGRFTLAGLDPKIYRLHASAPGFQVGGDTEEVEAGTSDVVLVLSRGGGFRARVVDEDGASIESVDVSVQPAPPVAGRFGQRFGPLETEGGVLLVENLDPGGYVLVVSASGLMPTPGTRVDVARGEVTNVGTIVLRKGGAIRGWVTDARDAPVPGARVRVADRFSYFREPSRSDAAGYFELPGLRDGVFDVTVSHPDFADATIDDVELRSASGPSTIRVRLTAGGRIEGIVRGRDGGGVPGRPVRLFERMPGDSTTTAPDGTFTFERVPAGLVRVQLMSQDPNLAANVQEREVTVAEGETTYVQFDSRPLVVSGQVTKGGITLGGVSVSFRPQGMRGAFGSFVPQRRPVSGPIALNAVTTADGFYELYVDGPGRYEVTVSSADRAARYPRKDVTIPDVPVHVVDIDFASATIAGRVVAEATQEPVVEATVRAFPAAPGPVASAVGFARTDASGTFQLELDPGRYRIQVRADGFAPHERAMVSAEGAPELLVELEPGRAIRGRVLDAAGSKPARYTVRAVEDARPTADPPLLGDWANVDPDGTFELRDLAPGRYNLLAGSDLDGFAFVPGVEPGAELTLTLRPAAWVHVRAVDPDGSPVPGARIAVTALGGRKVRGAQGTTDADGRLALYAPEGALQIKAVKGNDLSGTTVVQARSGERVPAEIALSHDPR